MDFEWTSQNIVGLLTLFVAFVLPFFMMEKRPSEQGEGLFYIGSGGGLRCG